MPRWMLSGSSGAGLDRSGKIVSYRLITAPIIVGSMSAIPTRTPSLPHDLFHPAVRDWFTEELGRPTAPQVRAWPSIKARRHTLIAAPTGSGKTLAAFLAVIDDLVREGLENGGLPDHTLNLVGILTPGARVPSVAGNRVLYRDGVPVATVIAGKVHFLEEFDAAQSWEVEKRLLRRVPATQPAEERQTDRRRSATIATAHQVPSRTTKGMKPMPYEA